MRRIFVHPFAKSIALIRLILIFTSDVVRGLSVNKTSLRRAIVALSLMTTLLWQTLLILPSDAAHAAPIFPPPVAKPSSGSSLIFNQPDVLLLTSYLAAGAAFLLPIKDIFEHWNLRNFHFGESLATAVIANLSSVVPAARMENADEELGAPYGPGPGGSNVKYDFDGDGKADIGRWQKTGLPEFKVQNSNGGSFTTYSTGIGSSTSISTPGDFNGDGKTDPGTFDGGTWTWKPSPIPNATPQTISLGAAGDIPVASDYDSDGITDAAVFRPSTGHWYVRKSSTGSVTDTDTGFTSGTNIPFTGDFDFDRTIDKALYRWSTHQFIIFQSSGGTRTITFGSDGDIPVNGDFDRDGKADLVLFTPNSGGWSILRSSWNYSLSGPMLGMDWGNAGDEPVPADYDGDGFTDYAVWRPATGTWHIKQSSNSSYQIKSLGSPGNTAVPSSYVRQVAQVVYTDTLEAAMLSPKNAVGATNLYSQNFGWSQPIVNLPGRAGMDLNLGISYNSLVWVKDAVKNEMVFDPDLSNVSPGFRLTFPVIETDFTDVTRNVAGYIMVMPNGKRVEFLHRQSEGFHLESNDSNFAQLDISDLYSNVICQPSPCPPEFLDFKMVVTGSDGTVMDFQLRGGVWKNTKVTDRNGNYITIEYGSTTGAVQKITDTLGREITVEYDPFLFPTAVKQTWKGNNGQGSDEVHTYATFTYGTLSIATNFSGFSSIVGPTTGTSLKVLNKITYADNSATTFEYNGYGQVTKVNNLAPDTHTLNYVAPGFTGGTSDCPRLASTSTMTDGFNGNVPVVTNFTASSGQNYTLPGSRSIIGAFAVDVTLTNHPNNLTSRVFYGDSGLVKGLPLGTLDCIGTCPTSYDSNSVKRWTWTNWRNGTQSVPQPVVSYQLNPQIIDTVVGDGTNIKGSYYTYYWTQPPESPVTYPFNLPEKIEVYNSTPSNVVKRTEITYDHTSDHEGRNIIGLPLTKVESGRNDTTQALETVSSINFGYDEDNFSQNPTSEPNQNITNIIQHENPWYSLRGNLTSITRNSVPSGPASQTVIHYDTAGSPVAQIDPMGRKTRIEYTDNFNDSTARNTYAYPKSITDPSGSGLGDIAHSVILKYRFDIGAKVESSTPAPTGQYYGKTTQEHFDSLGRPDQESIFVGSTLQAYVKHAYPVNGVQSQTWSTNVDSNSSGVPDAGDEVYSENWTDGAGRVRRSRTEHPGSSSGWSGSVVEYDIVGRVKRSSVPTEISVPNQNDPNSWIPTGDDNRGNDSYGNPVWLWNSQEYDWKGRVIHSVPSDSTGADGKDTVITYDGCGCAGGQLTTVQGENIIETDWQGNNPTTLGRRTQKVHEDILGRNDWTKVMNWDGSTVYSSTVNKYNGRDQILNTYQYPGDIGIGTFRAVSMSYDGLGRMATRQYSIEALGTNTSWTYNADDSINTTTDPRGVTTSFAYGTLTGLLASISYSVPGGLAATVPNPGTVSFAYDNVGNRTSMSDGSGSSTYIYNSLSQMTSESKNFTGVSGTFTTNYTYNLSGTLKTMSNPLNSGQLATYSFDKLGRATGVAQTQGSSNIVKIDSSTFRAWGTLKEYHTVQGASSNYDIVKYSYDSRLNVSKYERGTNTSGLAAVDYARYADGLVKKVSSPGGSSYTERTYKYDNVGRLTTGLSGHEANPDPSLFDTPYKNLMTYNAFSDTTQISGHHWGHNLTTYSPTIDATSGRVSTSGYDSAGNIVSEQINTTPIIVNRTLTYDAAGRNVHTFDPLVHTCCENNHIYDYSYDGNGWQALKVNLNSPPSGPSSTETTFFIRSTVLGGTTIGERKTFSGSSTVEARFITPVNGVNLGARVESAAPEGVRTYGQDAGEMDVRGSDVGTTNPYTTGEGGGSYPNAGGDATNYNRCAEGGEPIPCDKMALFEMRFEGIEQRIRKGQANNQQKAASLAGYISSEQNSNFHKSSGPSAETSPSGTECPVGTEPRQDASGAIQCVGVGNPTVEVRGEDLKIDWKSHKVSNAWGYWTEMGDRFVEKTSQIDPCSFLTPLWLAPGSRIARAVERRLHQSVLADGMKVQASFLGASLGLQNTRDGDVIFGYSGAVDPKGLFLDIPNTMFKGAKLAPSLSMTGQKILAAGSLSREDRLGVFTGWSANLEGGLGLYGGLDINNPGLKDQVNTLSLGYGTGISGGASGGTKLPVRSCLSW